MSSTFCPVCAHDLGSPPWDGDSASFDICQFCGIQFGYNDAHPDLREAVYAEWRRQWIANGRRAFTGDEWHRVAILVASEAQKLVAKV